MCLNDGAQPEWMDQNPSVWLSSTLDACCSRHFSWNYKYCMGALDDTCARALYYPDWEGENKACTNDGNEPAYMIANPGMYMFSSQADCCAEHYSHNEGVCLGNGVSSLASGDRWYPDWTQGVEACKNDGNAPQYMLDKEALWLYDDRDSCCTRYFEYKQYACMMDGSGPAPTGHYYPDWEGDNKACLLDSATTPAPEWMTSRHTANDQFMFDSLEECCEQHYAWSKTSYVTGGGAAAPTGHYFPDFEGDNESCLVDSTNTPAPDYMTSDHESDGHTWLYDTLQECCEQHFSYRLYACTRSSNGAPIPSGHFYPDWEGDNLACLEDSVATPAPLWMAERHTENDPYMFDSLAECCEKYYHYREFACNGGSAAAPTGHYFPDWEGNNQGCLIDSTATPAPEYMTAGHASDEHTYLYDTLDECCEHHYPYAEEECMGVGGSTTAGTNQWYIDWTELTCVKDCIVSSSDPDCGGLADTFGKSNLHDDKRTCCSTHMSYDFRSCFN